MKLEFSGQISKNIQTHNFMKILPVGVEKFHADRRTDITKLIVAFRYCTKAHKNSYMFRFLRDQGSKHVGVFNI
jgi:hypothetical protein